jgi:hypothetical protein
MTSNRTRFTENSSSPLRRVVPCLLGVTRFAYDHDVLNTFNAMVHKAFACLRKNKMKQIGDGSGSSWLGFLVIKNISIMMV